MPPSQVPPLTTSTTAWSSSLQPWGWLAGWMVSLHQIPPRETLHACSQEQAPQPELAHGPGAQAAIHLPQADLPTYRNPAFVLAGSTA